MYSSLGLSASRQASRTALATPAISHLSRSCDGFSCRSSASLGAPALWARGPPSCCMAAALGVERVRPAPCCAGTGGDCSRRIGGFRLCGGSSSG